MNNEVRLYRLLKSQWFIMSLSFGLLLLITLNRPMMVDEGMWNYIGRIWLEHDLPPYQDSVENKTPGIFYLFTISHGFFGVNFLFVRMLGILSIVAGIAIIRKILTHLHSEPAAVLGMYFWGLGNTWNAFDGHYSSVTESFMCLFVLLAFWSILKADRKKHVLRNYLLSGVYLGLAVSFKQVALFSMAGLFLFFLLVRRKRMSSGRILSGLGLILASSLAAHGLMLLPLMFSGVSFREYFEGAWLILLNPGTYEAPVQHLYSFFQAWFNERLFFFLLIIPLAGWHYHLLKKPWFLAIVIWLFLDFVAINISGTYHAHQFKQILITFSLLLPVLFAESFDHAALAERRGKKSAALMLTGLIIIMLPYESIVINGYFRGFPDPPTELGKWIEANTKPEDSVFCFLPGKGGTVMAYSDRVSPYKYFHLIFLNPRDEKSEFMKELYNNPPDVMVTEAGSFHNRARPDSSFMSNYRTVRCKHGFSVYFSKDMALPENE